jgi:hypothetical protein
MSLRLSLFLTHPIQYQALLLRILAWNEGIDLKVFFLSDLAGMVGNPSSTTSSCTNFLAEAC